MSDGSLSSLHSPTDETAIDLAERLTARWRRAAGPRFSLCSGCAGSVRLCLLKTSSTGGIVCPAHKTRGARGAWRSANSLLGMMESSSEPRSRPNLPHLQRALLRVRYLESGYGSSLADGWRLGRSPSLSLC